MQHSGTQLSRELREQQHSSQYTFVHLKMEVNVLTQGSLDWTQEEDERIVWLFHTALISSTQQSDFWVSNLSISFNSSNNTFAWCLAQVQNETFLYIIVKLFYFFLPFLHWRESYTMFYIHQVLLSQKIKNNISVERGAIEYISVSDFPTDHPILYIYIYIYREREIYVFTY